MLDWRKVSKEDVKPDSPKSYVYAASKTLAERAAWDFAESHPDLDLTTRKSLFLLGGVPTNHFKPVIPPFVFGPLAPAHVVSDCSLAGLSTNRWIYQLVARPIATYPVYDPIHAVDVRDVAMAAVRALSAPMRLPEELQEMGQRRIHLLSGSFAWAEAVRHLAQVRPELKGRLVEDGSPSIDQGKPRSMAGIDTTLAKEILQIESFIGWHKMVEDAMDSILEREATWAN